MLEIYKILLAGITKILLVLLVGAGISGSENMDMLFQVGLGVVILNLGSDLGHIVFEVYKGYRKNRL